MDALDGVEIIAFADAAAWEDWLAVNHQRQEGVWLRMAKRRSGVASVTEDEVLDIGLCYGWVSGQRRALDERSYLQKYVPRRPRSLWSQVNVERVGRLLAEGRMREPGLAEVRAAQADGRWQRAYQSQRTATVPADVAAALDRDRPAKRVFDGLDRSSQYRLYLPVLQAPSATTRRSRIAKLIEQLSEQVRAGADDEGPPSPKG
jgi:uncharacterized protein YdeI (YjbR/CyaY-like superfamily)